MTEGLCAVGAGSSHAGGDRRGGAAAGGARPTGSRAPSCGCRFPSGSVRDGAVVCSQALMALADTAMVIACSAAWNGYRPMSTIDQTTHFLRPVNFDVLPTPASCASAATPASAASCCFCRRQAAGRHGGERLFDAGETSLQLAAAADLPQPAFNCRHELSKLALPCMTRGGVAMHRKLLVALVSIALALPC